MVMNMTQRLKELMKRAENWPAKEQEALADVMDDIEQRHDRIAELTDDDWKVIDQRVAHGDIATDEEVAAVFNRYRRA
jgi:polyhydroxyalkanoate synthesis regulator phasin